MGTFLSAEWRNLLMANYKIEPKSLQHLVPSHTELDLFQGDCYVSLIGFLFKNTKVKGLGFPFHRTFEEINLRFYVRHKAGNEWRRGVVFIKEIVPRPIITLIANTIYDENYVTLPTKHKWTEGEKNLSVEYGWQYLKRWNTIQATAEKAGHPLVAGSKEEFITEHYWGYAQNKRGFTTEYAVEHPRWNIHKVLEYDIDCQLPALYGTEITHAMETIPSSIFLADGSAIKVMDGKKVNR